MAGMHLLSDQGLRLDGRRANELRQIRCKLGVFSQPDGSAYLEQGNTKVLAAVYGPHEVKHTNLTRDGKIQQLDTVMFIFNKSC
jgi:exosome complex component RRP41